MRVLIIISNSSRGKRRADAATAPPTKRPSGVASKRSGASHAPSPAGRARTSEPLRIVLSDTDIEAHRPAARTSPPEGSSREEGIAARLELLRTLMAARARLHEVADIIVDSADRQTASTRVQALLGCTPESAGAVLAMSLQRFGGPAYDSIVEELRELELESGDEEPHSSP